MKDHQWVAIDVETATNYRRSICSLGVATIAPDGSRVEREWLVKPPGNRYDAENTALHGLDADATERAPTFPEVWAEASEIIAGADVIAHYAEFDTDCIRAAMRHYHQTEPVFSPLGCTLRMAHLVWPQRTASYSLASLCEDHQIPHTPHKAASDAAAVMTLAGVLVAQWGQGDFRQLRAASNRGHQARSDAAQKRQWHHSTAPPSERQIDFLRTLLTERHIRPETILRHISTSGQMSRLIDEILEGPRVEDVSSASERKRYKSRLERTLRQIVENPLRAAPAPTPTRTMSPAETAARRDANRVRRVQERQSTENFRQQSRDPREPGVALEQISLRIAQEMNDARRVAAYPRHPMKGTIEGQHRGIGDQRYDEQVGSFDHCGDRARGDRSSACRVVAVAGDQQIDGNQQPDQRARYRLGVTAGATDLRLCSAAAAECPQEAAPGGRSGAPSHASRGSARRWGESASRPCNGAYMMMR